MHIKTTNSTHTVKILNSLFNEGAFNVALHGQNSILTLTNVTIIHAKDRGVLCTALANTIF